MNDDDLPPESDLDPEYLLPGTRLGRYTIIERLAKGGFGVAYRVTRDGTELLMKVLLVGGVDDAGRQAQRQRIRQEFGVLQGIAHPNIIHVHEFAVLGNIFTGHPYLVEDLVDGLTVYEWQHFNQPSLRQICRTASKIADALVHMHSKGLFHRDIKADNIMVRADGEPVIIDFGIARTQSSRNLTKTGHMVGTITHFSPEYLGWTATEMHAQGKEYPYYPQGDFYALGFMLYELCTGRPPFDERPPTPEEGDPDSALCNIIQQDPPVRPRLANPRIPPEMEEILLEMLHKDQHQRLIGTEAFHRLSDCVREPGPTWEEPFSVPLRAASMLGRRSPRGTPKLTIPSGPPVFAVEPPPPAPKSTPLDRLVPGAPAGSRTPRGAASLPQPAGSRTPRGAASLPLAAGSKTPRGAASLPLAAGSKTPRGAAIFPAVGSKTPRGAASAPQPASQEAAPSPTAAASTPLTREERASAPKDTPAFQLSEEPKAPSFQAPVESSHHERPTEPHFDAVGIPSALKTLRDATSTPSRRLTPAQGVAAALLLVLVALWGATRWITSAPKSVGVNLTHELDDARAAELAQATPSSPLGRGSRLPPPSGVALPVAQPSAATAPLVPVTTSAAVPVQPGSGSLNAVAGASPPPTVTPPSATPPGPGPRSTADQSDIDRILAKTYGHPTVPGPQAAQSPKPEPAPESPFAPVQYLGHAKGAAAAPGFGIGTGRRIHVRLRTPLDSRTLGDGMVEFQVTAAVSGNGDGVIPALTLGYGRASTSGGRFTLAASLLRLPNGSEIPFTAAAYDLTDSKPGLPAGRTIAPPPTQGDSVATTVAKTTANTALTAVTGGIGQDMARNAAGVAVNANDQAPGASQTVLLLDAPYEFELMVQKPF